MAQSAHKPEEQTVIIRHSAHDLELCVQSFGSPKNPAILLIMGATASMVWWDADFCRRLAAQARFVIRYDNRDVGRSTCYPPGPPPYNVLDMADDALMVLDHFGIQKAHLMGMSLGGMIAQLIALRQPGRVQTISMFASGIWADRPDLPPMDPRVPEYHAVAAELDWTDTAAVIDYMVGGWRILNGSRYPFEEERIRRLAAEEVARAGNLLSMFNHAMLQGGEEYYGKAGAISVPVLVIHGTEDKVLPLPHAEAIADELPNARLLKLEGLGHELHAAVWESIIAALVEHTR